jgi:hypothetical protein
LVALARFGGAVVMTCTSAVVVERADRRRLMKLKKTAVKATLMGAMGAAAVGLGAGMAQADPFPAPPWPTPTPSDPGVSVEGPSLNAPGISVQGPGASIVPPVWAPPQPPPPPWAPFAPVQWNAEANVWGVYTNAGFQPVQ